MRRVVRFDGGLDPVAATLTAWRETSPDCGALVLLPEAEKHLEADLRTLCTSQGVRVSGAIFPAIVTNDGFETSGGWLIRTDADPSTFLSTIDPDDARSSADAIVSATLASLESGADPSARPTLFLIFDGMLPNIESILAQVYRQLGDRVRYAGVNAGSETFQPMPCVFLDAAPVTNAVLGVLIGGDCPFGLEHDYRPPTQGLVATSIDGNRIDTIDWEPAFEVYRKVIQRTYGVELTRDNFYEYGVHYPFGILRANGDVLVRIPVGLSDNDEIFCIGEIPANAMLVLLKAPSFRDNDCIEQLAGGVEKHSGHDALMTFYCAGRRMHMGDDAEQELRNLNQLSGAPTLFGALSLGEIGDRNAHYPLFHNAAVICRYW